MKKIGVENRIFVALLVAGICLFRSVESFAAVMNDEAVKLGATKTHFMNPHGLPDEEHYVTVYDMYLIFKEAMKNKEFQKIARTAEYTCHVEHPSDTSKSRDVTWTSGNAFYNGKFSFADNMEILCGKTGLENSEFPQGTMGIEYRWG
jgi:D-alanyl-D-alanine carboxypeptidase (penicillin-binding protein 5/6)